MNILHIISGDGGGISSFVKTIIANSSKDYKYTVLSFTEYGEDFNRLARSKGCLLITMPRPKVNGYRYFFNYLSEFFKQSEFDFIHCHIPGIHSLPFKLISNKNSNSKFAIHSHQAQYKTDDDMNFLDRIINKLNPKINSAISDVKIACSEVAAIYGFGSLNEVEILYNSVDFDKFSKYFGNKSSNTILRIAHIGRHSALKNLEFIIALANYTKNNSDIQFEIRMFGVGEQTEMLLESIKDDNLEDVVILEGRHDNLEDYMKDIDVVLLPSYSEGFGIVALDAQASGTPIIVSKTITREIDLDCKLVSYLPIEKKEEIFQKWLDIAVFYKNLPNSKKYSKSQVYEQMLKKGFIDTIMVGQYMKLLNGFL